MQKKKLLAMVMTAVMTVGVITGCGSTAENKEKENNPTIASEDTNNDTADVTEEEITLTFGFWGDSAESEMKQELANRYMEANPNVNIEFEFTDGAGYLTKMQTWFSSNTLPDVFGLANDHFYAYKGNEQFEDLAPYIEKDGLSTEWDMEALNATFGEESGRIIATPFIAKTFAMAYNKELFDQAGVAYPTDEWTEAEMLAAGKKIAALSTNENKVYGVRWGVRPTEFYRNLYGNMMYDLNTYEMNAEGNEQFKKAVSLFVDTIQSGVAPDETAGAVSTGGFETGMYGMQLSATWDIATYQSMIGDSFQWDVVMLPMNTEFETRMLTTLRSNGWSMSSNAKNKEACWDFIKYLSISEESAKLSQSFGIPALLSYAESDKYLKDFGTGTSYDKGAFSRMQEWSTPFNNLGAFAEVNDAVKAEYELLLAGKTTIEEMIANCQKQGESILSAAK